MALLIAFTAGEGLILFWGFMGALVITGAALVLPAARRPCPRCCGIGFVACPICDKVGARHSCDRCRGSGFIGGKI